MWKEWYLSIKGDLRNQHRVLIMTKKKSNSLSMICNDRRQKIVLDAKTALCFVHFTEHPTTSKMLNDLNLIYVF